MNLVMGEMIKYLSPLCKIKVLTATGTKFIYSFLINDINNEELMYREMMLGYMKYKYMGIPTPKKIIKLYLYTEEVPYSDDIMKYMGSHKYILLKLLKSHHTESEKIIKILINLNHDWKHFLKYMHDIAIIKLIEKLCGITTLKYFIHKMPAVLNAFKVYKKIINNLHMRIPLYLYKRILELDRKYIVHILNLYSSHPAYVTKKVFKWFIKTNCVIVVKYIMDNNLCEISNMTMNYILIKMQLVNREYYEMYELVSNLEDINKITDVSDLDDYSFITDPQMHNLYNPNPQIHYDNHWHEEL